MVLRLPYKIANGVRAVALLVPWKRRISSRLLLAHCVSVALPVHYESYSLTLKRKTAAAALSCPMTLMSSENVVLFIQ